MSGDPKGGIFPVIAVGGLAVACCLGPLLIGGAAAGLSGWLADFGIGEVIGLTLLGAMLAFTAIMFRRKFGGSGTDAPIRSDAPGRETS